MILATDWLRQMKGIPDLKVRSAEAYHKLKHRKKNGKAVNR